MINDQCLISDKSFNVNALNYEILKTESVSNHYFPAELKNIGFIEAIPG